MDIEARMALVERYMGTSVEIAIDRPVGYVHKKEKYSLTYPVNYGYIPGVLGGDGEELDVYLLGVSEPLEKCVCRIIGAALRRNDVEDKLVAAPEGVNFTAEEIRAQVDFQEKWYDSEIYAMPHFIDGVKENADYYERPGAYFLPVKDGKIGVAGKKGSKLFFIGGGREKGETDEQNLTREVLEEIGYGIKIGSCFATAEQYKPDQTDIGCFHPYQYYYTGELTEKIAEPIEKDHFLVWVEPEKSQADRFALKMHQWAFACFCDLLNGGKGK